MGRDNSQGGKDKRGVEGESRERRMRAWGRERGAVTFYFCLSTLDEANHHHPPTNKVTAQQSRDPGREWFGIESTKWILELMDGAGRGALPGRGGRVVSNSVDLTLSLSLSLRKGKKEKQKKIGPLLLNCFIWASMEVDWNGSGRPFFFARCDAMHLCTASLSSLSSLT
jgi:hypothetical protein